MNGLLTRLAFLVPFVKKNHEKLEYLSRENELLLGIQRQLLIHESMLDVIYNSCVSEKLFCPICKNDLPVYLPFGARLRKNAQCPHCSSLERHRSLFAYLEKHTDLFSSEKRELKGKVKLLHFAPEKIFNDQFSNNPNIDYYPVDFNPNFPRIRDIIDIQNIKYADCTFDTIICNHVLEHIPDELKALNELRRVLKSNGICYILSPVFENLEKTLERPEYNTAELRFKHYGQHDHLRKYGKDFTERLERGGFAVEVVELNEEFTDKEKFRYGLAKNEKLYICT